MLAIIWCAHPATMVSASSVYSTGKTSTSKPAAQYTVIREKATTRMASNRQIEASISTLAEIEKVIRDVRNSLGSIIQVFCVSFVSVF